VSTLVAVELGVANGSNAGDGGRSDEPHQMALSAKTGHRNHFFKADGPGVLPTSFWPG